jgi:hypothetical protein
MPIVVVLCVMGGFHYDSPDRCGFASRTRPLSSSGSNLSIVEQYIVTVHSDIATWLHGLRGLQEFEPQTIFKIILAVTS